MRNEDIATPARLKWVTLPSPLIDMNRRRRGPSFHDEARREPVSLVLLPRKSGW